MSSGVTTVVAAVSAGAALVLWASVLKKLYAKRTAQVKLTYFNIRGLGEPIRFTLAYVGKAFEDYRFASRDEFIARKPMLRYGQVPCLQVDGAELNQSASIMRFVAASYDTTGTLYPSDEPARACLVDSLVDQVTDMTKGWSAIRYRERFGFPAEHFDDAAQKGCETFYLTDTLPRHLQYFESVLSADRSSPWLAGGAMPTIADFLFATVVQCTFVEKEWPVPVILPPAVAANIAALYNLPQVKAFQASEPKA